MVTLRNFAGAAYLVQNYISLVKHWFNSSIGNEGVKIAILSIIHLLLLIELVIHTNTCTCT